MSESVFVAMSPSAPTSSAAASPTPPAGAGAGTMQQSAPEQDNEAQEAASWPSMAWSWLPSSRRLRLIGVFLLIAWALTSVYKVQPDEQGVVLRFGKLVAIEEPGLHFHWPYPIDTVLLPRVTQINQLQLGDADAGASGGHKQMLTGDENIVEADCTVSWRIKDAGQFLFDVDDPERAVRLAAESALHEVIGRTPIQAALSDKRQQIADETKDLLQKLLDAEKAGVAITQVQLERVDPPAAVIDAFNDVQRARADQERARNDAQAYANDILPRARGEADHIAEDAEAYKARTVALAQGDAKSFLSVLESYHRAEDVTRWRLYLDAVDEVLRNASKVIVEPAGAGAASLVPYMSLGEAQQSQPRAAGAAPQGGRP
jgi:membrane protease subunit HflK